MPYSDWTHVEQAAYMRAYRHKRIGGKSVRKGERFTQNNPLKEEDDVNPDTERINPLFMMGEHERRLVSRKAMGVTIGFTREATLRWVDSFLSNLRYPARPTYWVSGRVVEPETGEVIANVAGLEDRISALETLTERLSEHITQLTWQVADLQADAIEPSLDAQELEALHSTTGPPWAERHTRKRIGLEVRRRRKEP